MGNYFINMWHSDSINQFIIIFLKHKCWTQERAVPPAVAEVGTEIVTDLVKQAVDKQIKIIAEQQKKPQEFIGKKVCICKTCKTYKAMPHLYITCLKKYLFGLTCQFVVDNFSYCLSWNQDDFE